LCHTTDCLPFEGSDGKTTRKLTAESTLLTHTDDSNNI